MSLKNGINLGGWLSQCDYSKSRYENFIRESDFKTVADWGFDHVRVPFDYELLETESGESIDSQFIYLDKAIEWGKKYGLTVILDLHKTCGYDFNDFGKAGKNNLFESDYAQKRFLNLWNTVSARYATESNVVFELLNEVTDLDFVTPWNKLIVRAVQTIRKNAPETWIIYGGVCWNSAAQLPKLVSPPAKNIIYTFHYYEPLLFTHQKASWVPALANGKEIPYTQDMEYFRINSQDLGLMGSSVSCSKASSMGPEFVEQFLQDAIHYAKQQGVPLYCGEFGVIDQADSKDTVNWFRDVLSVFDKNGIGHALWTYKEMDFGICGKHYETLRKMICK